MGSELLKWLGLLSIFYKKLDQTLTWPKSLLHARSGESAATREVRSYHRGGTRS